MLHSLYYVVVAGINLYRKGLFCVRYCIDILTGTKEQLEVGKKRQEWRYKVCVNSDSISGFIYIRHLCLDFFAIKVVQAKCINERVSAIHTVMFFVL